ncbi:unnamed protein product [Prorocentrum cordatum]|uniref:Uncharacterized protein n=1 Tax=Prorocentrum cordatum TaxID=2364126 RepID=A0ABN9U3W1_9DINO|nr:unnamed protein product [Polarella glacialis]
MMFCALGPELHGPSPQNSMHESCTGMLACRPALEHEVGGRREDAAGERGRRSFVKVGAQQQAAPGASSPGGMARSGGGWRQQETPEASRLEDTQDWPWAGARAPADGVSHRGRRRRGAAGAATGVAGGQSDPKQEE